MKNTANAVYKTEKVWFITGSSRGFGRIWTEAALKRGDKVAATARKTGKYCRPERKIRRKCFNTETGRYPT